MEGISAAKMRKAGAGNAGKSHEDDATQLSTMNSQPGPRVGLVDGVDDFGEAESLEILAVAGVEVGDGAGGCSAASALAA